MRELTPEEVETVSGGGLDASTAGVAIIGLGLTGGIATALFALPIGFALLYADSDS